MSQIEDLQLELDSLLCKQSTEALVELCGYFEVKNSVDGKSRSELVRLIRNDVENTLATADDNFDGDIFLRDAISKIKGTPPPLERSEEELIVQMEVLSIEKKLEELKQLQIESDNARKTLLEQLRAAKGKVSETDHSDLTCNVVDTTVKVVKAEPSVLVREFKISGQIGEPGQKDKLTYVSLIHQIDSGLERGYSDKDICDAVIKAISPHSSLRNYILTLPQRSLKKLRSILCVFFQEKTAADLFQSMVTAIQDPKETAQQFLLHLLDARNRVFFAAKEERAEGEYSSQLVEKSFLKAFESGLRDENLVTNLRPFLRTSGVTDEELMKNVNELATKQQERKTKIGATSERSKTAKAQAVSPVNETAKLTAEIQQLKTQLAEIVHEVKTSPRGNMPPRFASRSRQWSRSRWQGGHSGPPRYRRLAGCQKCQSNGTSEQCAHCFQCGELGHFRSRCPVMNQGNLARLFQGGKE